VADHALEATVAVPILLLLRITLTVAPVTPVPATAVPGYTGAVIAGAAGMAVGVILPLLPDALVQPPAVTVADTVPKAVAAETLTELVVDADGILNPPVAVQVKVPLTLLTENVLPVEFAQIGERIVITGVAGVAVGVMLKLLLAVTQPAMATEAVTLPVAELGVTVI
jgi:hypothetical protein